MIFSKRLEIERDYYTWATENNVKFTPSSVIVYLQTHGYTLQKINKSCMTCKYNEIFGAECFYKGDLLCGNRKIEDIYCCYYEEEI